MRLRAREGNGLEQRLYNTRKIMAYELTLQRRSQHKLIHEREYPFSNTPIPSRKITIKTQNI